MKKHEFLKKYFGYSSFRNGQEQLIDNILSLKDVLGIMPTGGGKSLCYQVPALMFDGVTLVISPLISLMKDQVQALISNGIPAAFINSMLSANQTLKALENAKNGKYKIIYAAPERLDMPEFLDFSRNVDISMLAVDEAHCISQWGQNFRPSYLKISNFIDSLPKRPIVSAFTATATGEVKEDIVKILKLNDPFIIVTGFNRENLYFEVQKPDDKYKVILDYLKNNSNKSGIIYCNTRKAVDELVKRLTRDNYLATSYHAGLSEGERTKNQDDFLFDRKTIMIATNAFGMGIDKSNVSFVIHYNMPKNLESYYQEAGRAGRDGAPAECILLYGGQDVITNQFLIDSSTDNTDLTPDMAELVKEKDREKLKQMTYYCHTSDCLREYVLKYFGDKPPNYCGNCSNCNTNFEEIDILEYSQKVLSCIARMGERYGLKMVIDTLRGSKAEKIFNLKLNQLSTYGIMSEVKEKRIRDIINYLVLNGYIELTNSEFPVAKLTHKSKELLFSREPLFMKIAMEKQEVKLPQKKMAPINSKLLTRLKELRLKLAQEKKVPAFVVFSDASLIDMCKKMPSNDNEFLEVIGVGGVKLEQYGKLFLDTINSFEEFDKDQEIDECEEEKYYVFDLKEACNFIKSSLEISEEAIPVSIFADKINGLLLQKCDKKISAQKLADYLVDKGYLELETMEGKNSKVASLKGNEIGITTVLKERPNGESYKQNFYDMNAQKFLVDEIQSILEYIFK